MHPLCAFLDLVVDKPDQPLVMQGERAVTRLQLHDLAGAFAAGLSGRLGSSDNENLPRVLLSLKNSVEMIALIPAIWSLGALPMFISASASETQFRAVVERYKPDLVIDETVLASLRSVPGRLGDVRPGPDADASVVFTSGSTGVPKGVVQKGATLSSGVMRVARTLGYADSERILVPIPFAHDYGWGQMLSGLVGGHALILPARDILPDIALAINAHRPTVIAGVPSLFSALLFGISGFERADTVSVRMLTSTGSPFSPKVYDALQARIPDARILRNYGLTETYRSCCLKPEDAADHPVTVGQPIEGVQIKIVDPDGNLLPFGQEGEIVHQGAGILDRYLDDPVATAQTLRELEGKPAVFTGDIGVLDESGFLTLLGRRDRLVKSMDIRINLNDVEESLNALETVELCAIIPTQDDLGGTVLVAFCIPKAGRVARDIQRDVNRNMPAHMRPRLFHCLEQMPRTSVGKIDYPALKAILLSGQHSV